MKLTIFAIIFVYVATLLGGPALGMALLAGLVAGCTHIILRSMGEMLAGPKEEEDGPEPLKHDIL